MKRSLFSLAWDSFQHLPTRRERRAARRQWSVESLESRALLNAAPVLTKNTGLSANDAAPFIITPAQLQATDADGSATLITFALTKLPTHGSLKLSGNALGLGGSFTQQDINDGKVTYVYASGSLSDTFSFALSDGNHKTSTETVSVDTSEIDGNSTSFYSAVSADGRFVAFASFSTNLVANDTNNSADIFLRDCQQGTTTRISVGPGGVEANSQSFNPSFSADGKFIVYESNANNLVAGDTNNAQDIFLYQISNGQTTRVSISDGEAQSTGSSFAASLSSDGRFVVFESDAANLVTGDTNNALDIFVRDRTLGTTTRASVSDGEAQLNGQSMYPSISSNGNFVAFATTATNAVVGDTNGVQDVFVRDIAAGTTTRVSVANTTKAQSNASSGTSRISADGAFVVYESDATNLVTGDTNLVTDIFISNRQGTTTSRVSLGVSSAQSNVAANEPVVSSDGRYVAFRAADSNLVSGDTNGKIDVFRRDRTNGVTTRVSVDPSFSRLAGDATRPSISADGRVISFETGNIYVFDAGVTKAATNVTITHVNHAPVLNNTNPLFLNPVPEDAPAPVGQVGTKVSDLVGFASASTGKKNVTDADAGALLGIAITISSPTHVGYFSLDNGSTWQLVGTCSETSALLLAANTNTRVYYKPAKDFDGLATAFDFRAWDQSTGTNGGRTAATLSSTSAFSSATHHTIMAVASVNDAPVLDTTENVGVSNKEGAGVPVGAVGTKITSLVDLNNAGGTRDNVSDVDGTSLTGIAVTSGISSTYYSIDNGAHWSRIALTSGHARLLAADGNTRIYVQVGSDYAGFLLSAFTFRAWDQTSGANGDLVDVTSNGGTTAFSSNVDTCALVVSNINDAPVLTDHNAAAVLNTVEERAGAPFGPVGTLVSSLIDITDKGPNVLVSDVDPGAKRGIGIVGLLSQGKTDATGYFSINNGATWTLIGSPTINSVRLLAADTNTRIYFQPKVSGPNLLALFAFAAWDQTSGTNGQTVDFAQTKVGGATAFSSDINSAGIGVSKFVNDAPLLNSSKSPVLNPVAANAGQPVGKVGTLVSSLVDFANVPGGLDNVTDPDGGAKLGIAIVRTDTSHGAWYYTTDGVTWKDLGAMSETSSRFLKADANTRIYFRPFAQFRGTIQAAITFRACDSDSASNGFLGNVTATGTGGSKPFSTATDFADITVV